MRFEDRFADELGNDPLTPEEPSVETLDAFGRRVQLCEFEVDISLYDRARSSSVPYTKVVLKAGSFSPVSSCQ